MPSWCACNLSDIIPLSTRGVEHHVLWSCHDIRYVYGWGQSSINYWQWNGACLACSGDSTGPIENCLWLYYECDGRCGRLWCINVNFQARNLVTHDRRVSQFIGSSLFFNFVANYFLASWELRFKVKFVNSVHSACSLIVSLSGQSRRLDQQYRTWT